MGKTIEQKVADALLQQTEKVKVGAEEYDVAPPTIATLVMVSGIISTLPKTTLDTENLVQESLRVARHTECLGKIASVLILGAKRAKEKRKGYRIETRKRFFGLFSTDEAVEFEYCVADRLAEEINETFSPSRLHELIAKLLNGMELADFFAITTFLTEVNMLKATKVEI